MSLDFTEINVMEDRDFGVTDVLAKFSPRYNAAPTTQIPIIIPGSRILDLARWGLIPKWAKDSKIGNALINARSETLEEKPSFRESFKKNRCLVLASGFFEWDTGKHPFYFQVKNKKIFAFAGLWSDWKNEKGENVRTCTIITCEPNSLVKRVHDRMPVILKPGDYEKWLKSENIDEIKGLLKPFDAGLMTEYEVSTKMNSPRVDGADLLMPIGKVEKQKNLF